MFWCQPEQEGLTVCIQRGGGGGGTKWSSRGRHTTVLAISPQAVLESEFYTWSAYGVFPYVKYRCSQATYSNQFRNLSIGSDLLLINIEIMMMKAQIANSGKLIPRIWRFAPKTCLVLRHHISSDWHCANTTVIFVAMTNTSWYIHDISFFGAKTIP